LTEGNKNFVKDPKRQWN